MPDIKKIAEHYDRISKYYDMCGLLGSDRLLSRLLSCNLYSEILCHLEPGDAVLDVACGTGNMSSEPTKKLLVVNLIERALPSSLKDKMWWLIF